MYTLSAIGVHPPILHIHPPGIGLAAFGIGLDSIYIALVNGIKALYLRAFFVRLIRRRLPTYWGKELFLLMKKHCIPAPYS